MNNKITFLDASKMHELGGIEAQGNYIELVIFRNRNHYSKNRGWAHFTLWGEKGTFLSSVHPSYEYPQYRCAE